METIQLSKNFFVENTPSLKKTFTIENNKTIEDLMDLVRTRELDLGLKEKTFVIKKEKNGEPLKAETKIEIIESLEKKTLYVSVLDSSNEKDDKSSVPVNRYILDVPPKTAFNKQDQDGLLVSWKLTTVGEDQINEARKMALEIFQNFTYHEKPTVNQGEGKEKQLCPLVKSILQLLCNKFEQYLWCDPGNHTEGERYPDFATSSVKVGSQPKFDEFRLLFEVERQVFAANSSSTKLVTSGITGIGQFIQWMHKSNAHTVKYGAVTDYQNWVFLRAVKTNGRWEIGKSHKCLVYNPKSSFFPNQPCSAFENLCLIFLLEQNTQK